MDFKLRKLYPIENGFKYCLDINNLTKTQIENISAAVQSVATYDKTGITLWDDDKSMLTDQMHELSRKFSTAV